MKRIVSYSVKEKTIEIHFSDGEISHYPIKALPETFLVWQIGARLHLLESIKKNGVESIKTQPAHLPVLASLGSAPFYVNLSTRGIGLLPKKDKIQKFIELFNSTREKFKNKPWRESITERMEILMILYNNVDNFNKFLLGGLEIFGGETQKNLKNYPLSSLLYTGESPKFVSFQFNGLITFIRENNLYYQFLLAVRELFAHDNFHVPQLHYLYGYLFYPVEIKEKTPFSRKEE
ncbi:MAG: hypothetical protein ACFFHV_20385 [Promethearchaeota archaeon]